jgi:hypothetical protein
MLRLNLLKDYCLSVAESRQVKQFLRTNAQPQEEVKEEVDDYATAILRIKSE